MGRPVGLRWEDVDLKRGRLAVRRTGQYLSGEGMAYQEPKAERAQRSIMLGATRV